MGGRATGHRLTVERGRRGREQSQWRCEEEQRACEAEDEVEEGEEAEEKGKEEERRHAAYTRAVHERRT